MTRSLAEWHDAIKQTLDNAPHMGGWQWAMVTLLSQIAYILLDIREYMRVLTVTDER